jgi:hypothetical protein
MGAGSNQAQREAQAEERRRQARIDATSRQIESIYSSPAREGEIGDYISAVRQRLLGDLNEKKAETDRQNRFALARSGQMGGSLQVDRSKRLNTVYGKGVLGVEQTAQAAGQDVRGADQQSRLQLLGLAQSGIDTTTAAQSLRNNLFSDRPTQYANTLGQMFGGFTNYFDTSRNLAEQRRAEQAFGQLYGKPGGGKG